MDNISYQVTCTNLCIAYDYSNLKKQPTDFLVIFRGVHLSCVGTLVFFCKCEGNKYFAVLVNCRKIVIFYHLFFFSFLVYNNNFM